jgi:GWxTD domain-containing protein
MRRARITLVLLCLLSFAPMTLRSQKSEEKSQAKYYDKWLNQDVIYIITDEERAVFKKLQTPEEKDTFIEQFWLRRAPDPNRGANEFREEHYRRIAFANDNFASGIPGWKTDRGRIYIMYGAPAEIEDHSGGENYIRKPNEGGGETAVYPFQVWRYRNIEGVGDDIEIEFVDRSWSGEYRQAMNSWEKDMLMYVDGMGETTSERLGLASRAMRPGLHPGNLNDMSMMSKYGMHSKDMPFEKMLQYFNLQRPPVIRQKELQEAVQARVSYNLLPFSYGISYVYMEGDKALVPITLEIENKELLYRAMNEIYRARVGLYGAVTALSGKIVAEFEDTIYSEYTAERLPQGQTQKSMYQRHVLLPAGRYKLDFIVKDINADKMGTLSTNLSIPKMAQAQLSTSPLILAKVLQPMDTFPDAPQTFVLGDLKVVPNITRTFKSADHLNIYFQVYNATIDSSQSRPRLVTQYTILQGDKLISQLTDTAGTSLEYASEARAVMARRLGLQRLVPGKYRLKVEVSDSISGQTASQETAFDIVAP